MTGAAGRTQGRDLAAARLEPPRTLFAIGPGVAICAALGVTLLAAWAAAATWYIASREDLVAELLRRQAVAEARYEDHIGALRARLDRVASQKLLDQDSLQQRVGALVNRQVELETRQAVLADLARRIAPEADVATTAAIPPPPARPAAAGLLPPGASAFAPVGGPADEASAPKPRPEPSPFQLRLRGEGSGGLLRDTRLSPDLPLDRSLQAVEGALSAVEATQVRALAALAGEVRDEAALLRTAIRATGLDPEALEPASPDALAAEGMGGPFIPIGVDAAGGDFESLVDALQQSLVDRDRLRRTAVAIPFARPVDGDVAVTSGFGVRADPFTRRPAFHAGIDFRAETGAPVRATAAGRVVAAGYSGGYGKLVEIDHGNGLATRFAHLSAIHVSEGDDVAAGALLGYAGSTGRSTGPHLHYETRIDGRAVDPRRFLEAGELLAGEEGG